MKINLNKRNIFCFVTLKGYICETNLIYMTMEKLNFDAVYNEYRPLVMARLRTKIRSNEEREDVCQDIFIKVLNFLEVYNCDKAKLNTWIFTIVNNHLTDTYRKNALAKSEEGAIVTTTADFVDSNGEEFFQFFGSGTASDAVENAELQKRIAIAFRGLKPKYRKVAILFFLREKKYEEIVEICNVPMGTVKGMLSRAKEMLQMALQTEYATL